MMKTIKNFIFDRSLNRLIKRGIALPENHQETTRNMFMSEVAKLPHQTSFSPFMFLKYGLVALLGIIVINGGAIIYADTTDVPATHPLYSYKLLAEEVKVHTAPPEKRAELEVEYAERRVRELAALSETDKRAAREATTTGATIGSSTISHATSTPRHDNRASIRAELKANLKKHLQSAEKDASNKKSDHINTEACATINNALQTSLFDHDHDQAEIASEIHDVCQNESSQDKPSSLNITASSTSEIASPFIPVITNTNRHSDKNSSHKSERKDRTARQKRD